MGSTELFSCVRGTVGSGKLLIVLYELVMPLDSSVGIGDRAFRVSEQLSHCSDLTRGLSACTAWLVRAMPRDEMQCNAMPEMLVAAPCVSWGWG